MEENRRAKERNRKEMDRRGVEQKRQSLARIGIGIELKSEGKSKRCAEMRRKREEQ